MFRQISKWFLAVLCLLIIVGVPIGVIYPNVKNIEQLRDSIMKEYTYLNDRYTRGFYIKTLQNDYSQAIKKRSTLNELVLAPDSELKFIIQVEDIADANGVKQTPQLLTDGQAAKTGALIKMPFIITTSGPYSNTMKFIHELQGLPLVIVVERIRFSPSRNINDNESNPTIAATIGGHFYKMNGQ